MDSLQRFIDAQDNEYRIAYAEMKRGRKRSHWIWFIFPQICGLGKSMMSKRYGLTLKEAKEYLLHPILSLRLRNILFVLMIHNGKDINKIMGGELDALKLQASLTLFDYLSPNDIFDSVLDIFYQGKRHKETLNIINYVRQ